MRLKIRKIKILYDHYWEVAGFISDKYYCLHFDNFEAACKHVEKAIKRARKEASAFSMVSTIAVNLLSVQDRGLVDKLVKGKCRGITKAQYGYLRGIHERQEREW